MKPQRRFNGKEFYNRLDKYQLKKKRKIEELTQ